MESGKAQRKDPDGAVSGRLFDGLVCSALALAILAVYAPSLDHAFVTLDDYSYVVENEAIQQGLSPDTAAWAFTTFHGSSWFPLTWLSFAFDYEVGGLDPRVYHRTNIVLHATGAVWLYLALVALTRARGRSAFVAAVFALHPLHVESVAWVSERKDVLSALFFAAVLHGWAGYVAKPSALRYAAVLLAFALGLMSKSSLVTLPFVLLLLDAWPLDRLSLPALRLLLEKLPLFVLGFAAAALTAWAGASGDALEGAAALGPLARLGNAAIAYVMYLRDSVWPAALSPFYPHPGAGVSPLGSLLAGGTIALVSGLAISGWRRARPFAVGWFWFLGMLVPMIGLVQAGAQARADRFVHLPQIGLAIAIVYSLPPRLLASGRARGGVAALGAIAILAMAAASRTQLAIWQDGVTLFEHVVATAPQSAYAHQGLAQAYRRADRPEPAARAYRRALALSPGWTHPMVGLAGALEVLGQPGEAVALYERALRREPELREVRAQLVDRLLAQGAFERARIHLGVLADDERYSARAQAHAMLGALAERAGSPSAALGHYRSALQLDPGLAQVHVSLAALAFARGDEVSGIAALRRALQLDPELSPAANNLAWHLVTARDRALRDPREALRYAERAAALSAREDPNVLETLAAALEANGRRSDAVEVLDEALGLARRQDATALESALRDRRARLTRKSD